VHILFDPTNSRGEQNDTDSVPLWVKGRRHVCHSRDLPFEVKVLGYYSRLRGVVAIVLYLLLLRMRFSSFCSRLVFASSVYLFATLEDSGIPV
jgi:hypothetical protein